MQNKDEYFMNEAIKMAKNAYLLDEVPVGCVIVQDDKIIARGYNKRQRSQNVLEHAEIIAIKKASKKLKTWVLDKATIYITLEPCLMCAGTIIQSRIKRVVFASSEPKFGAFGSLTDLSKLNLNYTLDVEKGILSDVATKLLQDFFKELRKKKSSSNIDKN